MYHSEIDSFIGKFKHLWNAGFKATLNIEAEHGEALVTLRAGLGSIPPPFYLPRPPSQTPRAYRGPAYQSRQERRQAARAAAENVATHDEKDSSDVLNVTGNDQVAEEATANPPIEKNEVNEADKVSEFFYCPLCDFKSNWDNGLSIHITRKHGEIEQLDGHTAEKDDTEDEKYAGTKHYWEMGRLGTAYQTFLDANYVIDKSELEEDDKEKEKAKILDARKTAFGDRFMHFPPWS